jgi:hypothetical protein
MRSFDFYKKVFFAEVFFPDNDVVHSPTSSVSIVAQIAKSGQNISQRPQFRQASGWITRGIR